MQPDMDLFICGIIQTTFSGTTSEPLKCFAELGFIQILGILLALVWQVYQ